jgi:hypothetical protein
LEFEAIGAAESLEIDPDRHGDDLLAVAGLVAPGQLVPGPPVNFLGMFARLYADCKLCAISESNCTTHIREMNSLTSVYISKLDTLPDVRKRHDNISCDGLVPLPLDGCTAGNVDTFRDLCMEENIIPVFVPLHVFMNRNHVVYVCLVSQRE